MLTHLKKDDNEICTLDAIYKTYLRDAKKTVEVHQFKLAVNQLFGISISTQSLSNNKHDVYKGLTYVAKGSNSFNDNILIPLNIFEISHDSDRRLFGQKTGISIQGIEIIKEIEILKDGLML